MKIRSTQIHMIRWTIKNCLLFSRRVLTKMASSSCRVGARFQQRVANLLVSWMFWQPLEVPILKLLRIWGLLNSSQITLIRIIRRGMEGALPTVIWVALSIRVWISWMISLLKKTTTMVANPKALYKSWIKVLKMRCLYLIMINWKCIPWGRIKSILWEVSSTV